LTEPLGQDNWIQRYPKLTLLSLALFGCIIMIILIEFTGRLFIPGLNPSTDKRAMFWIYDELLGWANKPNQRGRYTTRDFSVEVTNNSHGMRDKEYPIERTGKRRMLVLGDSFGWGFGVEQNERFSEIIENAHPEWEIINASVIGYSTDQEFLFLKKKGMDFKPDVVLFLFYDNDFDQNIESECRYWYFKPIFVVDHGQLKLQNSPVPKTTIKQKLKRFFFERTLLGKTLYKGKNNISILWSLMERKIGFSDKNSKDIQQKEYDVTFHLIKATNELCKSNGSLFVLVSYLAEEDENTEKRTSLQRVCEDEKIPYLQLDKYFKATRSSIITFPHDKHWNTKGHKIVAEAIDNFLWKSGMLDHSSR
jgi:hypothetical protein